MNKSIKMYTQTIYVYCMIIHIYICRSFYFLLYILFYQKKIYIIEALRYYIVIIGLGRIDLVDNVKFSVIWEQWNISSISLPTYLPQNIFIGITTTNYCLF
jgi:hypothetical protein